VWRKAHGEGSAAIQRQKNFHLTPARVRLGKICLPFDPDLLSRIEHLSSRWRDQLGRILVGCARSVTELRSETKRYRKHAHDESASFHFVESSYFSPAWLPIYLGPKQAKNLAEEIVLPPDSDLFLNRKHIFALMKTKRGSQLKFLLISCRMSPYMKLPNFAELNSRVFILIHSCGQYFRPEAKFCQRILSLLFVMFSVTEPWRAAAASTSAQAGISV
jgi:hypothetical protein